MCEKTPNYKHLVISGGGIAGISLYTTIRDSNLRCEWDIKNIKSIHAVSAGSIIALIIALQYDWKSIDEYIINRPLYNLLKWNRITFMSFFYNCGIIDCTVFINILRPFFEGSKYGNEIDINITMKLFYEKTGISLHFYCTELFTLEKVEMSAEKTPELRVIDAIYRSSTIPFIMMPQRGTAMAAARPPQRLPLYVDGYLKTNYPSHECMSCCDNVDEDDILGFRLKPPQQDVKNIIDLAKSMIFAIGLSTLFPLKHEYIVDCNYFNTIDDIYLFLKSPHRRREIITGVMS